MKKLKGAANFVRVPKSFFIGQTSAKIWPQANLAKIYPPAFPTPITSTHQLVDRARLKIVSLFHFLPSSLSNTFNSLAFLLYGAMSSKDLRISSSTGLLSVACKLLVSVAPRIGQDLRDGW